MTHNRRAVLRAVGLAGLAGGVAGCLGGGGSSQETTAEPTAATTTAATTATTTDSGDGESMGDAPTVEVSNHPEHGDILVDGDGMTLYLFTKDSEGESVCYDSCADAWPPLTVDGEPTPPEGGLPGILGTTERDDGTTQVTYDGWPLYYFASDSEPGDATGHGVNDVWFVVHPEGTDSMEMAEPTVTVSEHSEYGDILVDADGMTLYLFTKDSEGESVCYDSCADAWPPLLVDGEPTPPEGGLPKELTTTERDDGSTQVVYDGWPLYYFASDSEPGDATGHGVNDVWFVVHPEGTEMKGGGETTTTEEGGSDDGGGGYGGDY